MKRAFFILSVCLQFTTDLISQPTLFGITSEGGDGFGTIYGIPVGGTNLSSLYKLEGFPGREPGTNNYLTEASNGKLYGLIHQGGAKNFGILCEYDRTNNIYTKLFDFDGPVNGKHPHGTVIQATNGKLYGGTYSGGLNNVGIIFEYDLTSKVFSKKVDLNLTSGGNMCGPFLQATNGKLYGLAYDGGFGEGTLFEYDISTNTYTVKVNFNGSNGRKPMQSHLMQAANGKIYGITTLGGLNDKGVLFEYDITTNTLTNKADFDGVSNGQYPMGSLIQASNGKIYGAAGSGGALNFGTIFQYDIATGILSKVFDFNGSVNGRGASCSLTEQTPGKLFGITEMGGLNDLGVLFEYNITTSVFTKKYDFDGKNGNYPRGKLSKLSSGELAGITYMGGLTWYGVIFEYNTSSNNYTKKVDIGSSNGGNIQNGFLCQAGNGKTYGMTYKGGTKNLGVLFEYDPKTNVYSKKLDFDTLSGFHPQGTLMEASNGKIYGATNEGGNPAVGILFEYDYSSNTYTKKHNFNSNGNRPVGKLIEVVPGKLYGLTGGGGPSNQPTIYEYDISSGIYTMKLVIPFANGGACNSSLIKASNNRLYGLANGGGANNKGFLFEYTPSTGVFIKKVDFDGVALGERPYSALCEAGNGKLYGTTFQGGTSNSGVLFEYDTLTGTMVKKMDFVLPSNGIYATTTLIKASNGKLYGTTGSNIDDAGVVFEYDYVTNTYTKKFDFNWFNGRNYAYDASLIEICLTPPASTLITSFNILCVGTTSNVSLSTPNVSTATSYSWNLPSGASILTGGGTNNITADFSTLSTGVYTLNVAGINVCGVGNSFAHTITVSSNLSPTVIATSSNSLSCTGQTVTLTSSGANTYTWSTGVVSNSIAVSPTTTTNYTVIGTDLNGCQNSSVLTQSVSLCTGIDELGNKEINVYPNPAQDELVIESAYSGKLELYDIIGKIIYSQVLETNRTKISLKNFAEGVYYLKITNKDKSNVVKIIKQ